MGELEELRKEIKKTESEIKATREGTEEIERTIDLTRKLKDLVYELIENNDQRAYDIAEFYLRVSNPDPSRNPWLTLDYLETKHPDLYGKIQSYKTEY